MSDWLLRATIREIRLEYNGTDAPGTAPPHDESENWNVLVAVLAYPRSGAGVVTSLRELNLASGVTMDDFGPDPTFFDNGLFKEVVQGETALKINVSDRERRNALARFVRRAMSGGLGALMSGRRGRMLGGMVGNMTKALSDAVVGSEQKIRNLTVGNTQSAHILIDAEGRISVPNAGKGKSSPIRWADGLLRLTLTAPRTFSQTVVDRTGKGRLPKAREQVLVAEGKPNGHVLLELRTVPRVAV